jgi:plasmid maintenance system antidote protein VapI
VLTGELIALAASKVADRATMTRMDATRLGKNFGYMVRNLVNLQECQYVDAANAVLDHHFNSHELCGVWTMVPS